MERPVLRSKDSLLAAAVVGLLAVTTATAQQGALSTVALTEGNPVLLKVADHLLKARAAARDPEVRAVVEAASGGLAARSEVRTVNGLAEIEIRLDVLTPTILAQLGQLGMEVVESSERWARVYGRLDLELLDEVAAIVEVTTIHPNYGAVTRAGAVTSQGDASINADDARSMFGVDGTGVTVGLISDSFNQTILGGTENALSGCARAVTGMTNQGSGDLPGLVTILDDCDAGGANCMSTVLTDEGAALGEIIHDLAPGADLAFHSAIPFPTTMATGIGDLVNCGADVIVDDVGYLAEPMFQDGIIAQAADAAVAAGVVYFSAAGNGGPFGVLEGFTDFSVTDDMDESPPSGDDFHDFGAGDRFAEVIIPGAPPGGACPITGVLQWPEPFSGTLGPGAASDLDLYWCTAESPDSCTFAAKTRQGCGAPPAPSGDPLEIGGLVYTGGSPLSVFMAVEHHCGTESLEFRVAMFASCGVTNYTFEAGIFNDPQIYGHPAAAGVVAVAAADYREIDSGGTFQDSPGVLDVQPFSSLGGSLPFFFDGSGMPLSRAVGSLLPGASSSVPGTRGPTAPETRFKPEITAPDGTNNTFFGIDVEPDGFPNFFGTSASAPHSAAVAALLLDATNELINPLPLKQLLSQGSLDMELPGLDDLSGFGFTDALRPIRSLDSSTTPLIDDLEFDLDEGDFFSTLPSPNQRIQAISKLTLGDGDYSGVEGLANEIIFTDGFESGDTSIWTSEQP